MHHSNAIANFGRPENVYLVVARKVDRSLTFNRGWFIAWAAGERSNRVRILELADFSYQYVYLGAVSKEYNRAEYHHFLLGTLSSEQRSRLEQIAGETPIRAKAPDSVWNHQSWVRDVLTRAVAAGLVHQDEVLDCIAQANNVRP